MLSSRIFSSCFPHKCDSCEQRFRSATLLQQHVIAAHVAALVEPKAEQLLLPPLPSSDTIKPEPLDVKQEPVPESENTTAAPQPLPTVPTSFVCARCGELFPSCVRYHEHSRLMHPADGSNSSASEASRDKMVVPSDLKREIKREVDDDEPPQEGSADAPAFDSDLRCNLCAMQFASWLLLMKHNVEHHSSALRENRVIAPTVDLTDHFTGCRDRLVDVTLQMQDIKPGADVSSDQDLAISQGNRSCRRRKNGDKKLAPDSSEDSDATAVTADLKFDCGDCSLSFATRRRLAQHEISHTADYNYQCISCHFRFRSEYALQLHAHTAHADLVPFKCPKCPRAFASQHDSQVHYDAEHGYLAAGQYKCADCERTFKHSGRLRLHRRIYHTTIGRGPKCFKCGRCFRHSALLSTHILRHHYRTNIDGGL